MRILHTVHLYAPATGGSEEVVRQLSERLALSGHEVTVATAHDPRRSPGPLNGVNVRGFRIAGNAVNGITGEAEAYQRFVLEGGFDLVMNYAAQSWATDLVLPLLDRLAARKVMVPCGYSGLHDPAYAGYFTDLPASLAKYDALVYMSANTQDAVFGRDHGLKGKALLIPNGAGEEFDRPHPGFRERHGIGSRYLLVCVANHTGIKGHGAVLDAFRRMRRRDATLAIIGNPVAPRLRPWRGCWWKCRARAALTRGVAFFRDLPRDEVVSALEAADLFLFASPVECAPLVMYEAFASRTPLVTTRVGNVSDHAEVLRLVDGPESMAAEANRLLDDDGARRELAGRAHALWKASHTWGGIAGRYGELYRSLVEGRGIPE